MQGLSLHCYRIRFLSEWDTQRQMLMDLIEKDEFWNNDNGSFCSFLAFVGTAIALWCHVLWSFYFAATFWVFSLVVLSGTLINDIRQSHYRHCLSDAVWLAVCLFVGFLCLGGYYSVLG